MDYLISFTGGPHDGKIMSVPGPLTIGLELLVRASEPFLPQEPYVFGEDRLFHYIGEGANIAIAGATYSYDAEGAQ